MTKKVKAKPTKANFKLNVELYKVGLMFSFGESDAEVLRHLLKLGVTAGQISASEFDYGNAYVFRFTIGWQLLRFKELPVTPRDFGRLAHEIFHAACGVVYDKDMTIINSGNEEMVAYIIGFITIKCYEQLNRYLN